MNVLYFYFIDTNEQRMNVLWVLTKRVHSLIPPEYYLVSTIKKKKQCTCSAASWDPVQFLWYFEGQDQTKKTAGSLVQP
jgi:hypothetical protein